MSRLSNAVREKMAVALVEHKFAERAQGLCVESVALFQAVYDDLYDAAMQKTMAALQKKGRAFGTNTKLSVNARGYNIDIGAIRIAHRSGAEWSAETEYRPMFHQHRQYGEISYADGLLANRLEAFADDRKSLIEDIDVAYRKAMGTLAQFSTGKKLAAEWPEAMPIIGKLIPEDDRTVPVIQLAAINADFGLPPSEQLAA